MTTPHRPLLTATAVAVLAVLGAAPALAAPDSPDSGDGCALAVLAVDGTKGPDTPTSLDPKSPLHAFTDPYLGRPDTTVQHIEYPAGMIAGVYGWEANLDESIEIGARNLRTTIRDTEQRCGGTTRYQLYGFSQGSLVVRKVVEEIAADRVREDGLDLQDRVQVTYVGDPATGVPSLFPGELIPGITLPTPATAVPGIPDQGICAPGDLICDPQGTLTGYATQHGRAYEKLVPQLPALPN